MVALPPVEKLRDEIDPASDLGHLLLEDTPEATADFMSFYLTVPTEYGQIVSMRPFPQQRLMLEEKTRRDVIVKGRQTRASSLIIADNVRQMINGSLWGATCVVGAQDDKTTATFRQRIQHHIFNDLNSKGFHFEAAEDNPNELRIKGLNNRFRFISGEQKSIVRGYSAQIVHLSEFAHWNERMVDALMGGLLPAVPGTGRIVLESTPKGETGKFYDYAMKRDPGLQIWKTRLYPWWLEPRYRVDTDARSFNDILLSQAEYDTLVQSFVPDNYEDSLMQQHGLTIDQILWRRIRKAEQDRTHAPFLQEYVEDLDTCWLGVQGKYFDTPDGIDHIQPYRDMRRQPRRYFDSLPYRGAQVPMYGQSLAVWEGVEQRYTYVLGFDAAGGGMTADSDWSVAYVMCANTEKVVARLRVQAPARNFAAMIAALATMFNGAMVNGERSHHGKDVFEELRALGYTNIYYHIDPTKPPKKGQPLEMGIYPSPENRNAVLTKLKTAITNEAIESFCDEFVREMNVFTWQKVQNAMRAQAVDASGNHDDCIFAMAQTWYIIDKARNRIARERRDVPADQLTVSGRLNIVVTERDMNPYGEAWRSV